MDEWRSFLKAIVLFAAAAAAHHATLLFGSFFFALPVIALAFMDRREEDGTSKRRHPGAHSGHCGAGGSGGCHSDSAVLDRAASLSGDADADSASQPRQLYSDAAVWDELLRRSLRSDDSGASVHLSARRGDHAAAAAVPRLLGLLPDRAGRDDAGGPDPAGPRIRSADDGALQLLGVASGAAVHRAAGG